MLILNILTFDRPDRLSHLSQQHFVRWKELQGIDQHLRDKSFFTLLLLNVLHAE